MHKPIIPAGDEMSQDGVTTTVSRREVLRTGMGGAAPGSGGLTVPTVAGGGRLRRADR
ncbi:MAG: hypothetical protein PVSMB4_11800 [Ktedonobacterales bacterium]